MSEFNMVEQNQRDRLMLLQAAYEASNTSQGIFEEEGLRQKFEWSVQQMDNARDYLQSKDLLDKAGMDGFLKITARGIDEIEKAMGSPEQGTEHFPPNVTLHVQTMNVGNVGNVEGSQQNIVGSTNVTAVQNMQQGMTIEDFANLAREIRSFQQDLGLSPEDEEILEAELKTIEAQASSPKPKLKLLKEVAGTVRGILVKAAPGIVTAGVKVLLGLP